MVPLDEIGGTRGFRLLLIFQQRLLLLVEVGVVGRTDDFQVLMGLLRENSNFLQLGIGRAVESTLLNHGQELEEGDPVGGRQVEHGLEKLDQFLILGVDLREESEVLVQFVDIEVALSIKDGLDGL